MRFWLLVGRGGSLNFVFNLLQFGLVLWFEKQFLPSHTFWLFILTLEFKLKPLFLLLQILVALLLSLHSSNLNHRHSLLLLLLIAAVNLWWRLCSLNYEWLLGFCGYIFTWVWPFEHDWPWLLWEVQTRAEVEVINSLESLLLSFWLFALMDQLRLDLQNCVKLISFVGREWVKFGKNGSWNLLHF